MGDVINNDGTGGESIHGDFFDDEIFYFSHILLSFIYLNSQNLK